MGHFIFPSFKSKHNPLNIEKHIDAPPKIVTFSIFTNGLRIVSRGKIYLLLWLLLLSLSSVAQSFFAPSDTLNRNRVLASHITLGTAYTTSMVGLASIWYSNQQSTGFQLFNDGKDWLQMDKVGHVYSAYWMQNRAFSMYNWAGMDEKRSLLWSSVFSTFFMTTFEVMDGFSTNYGFSISDVGANVLGIGFFTGQQMLFDEQIANFKFSYSHTPYAQYRPEVLGRTAAERILKDYNGQTYWLNVSLGKITPEHWKIPDWLCLSLGYTISEKLKSDAEYYEFNGWGSAPIVFNSYRRYLLSFDIDLSRLPVKKPWLKMLLGNFNTIKIPLPTVEWSSRNAPRFYGFYF